MSNSAQTQWPNKIILGFKRYAYIANTQLNGFATSTSILEYLKKYNIYTAQTGLPLQIEQCLQLDEDVYPENDRMLVYNQNEENLFMPMPMPFKSLAPQIHNTDIRVVSMYVYGGVDFRYPTSALYKDFEEAAPLIAAGEVKELGAKVEA